MIFRYHDTTGAIDVLLLRVGCQQLDHFVGKGLCEFAENFLVLGQAQKSDEVQ